MVLAISHILVIIGNAHNIEQECEKYENEIKKAGGIELFLGGIGTDGHIAFNEPCSSLVSYSHFFPNISDIQNQSTIFGVRYHSSEFSIF
jgi:glucosamine-6-phosphate deaminase